MAKDSHCKCELSGFDPCRARAPAPSGHGRFAYPKSACSGMRTTLSSIWIYEYAPSEQSKADIGEAVDRLLDRPRPEAQPFAAHLQEIPQFDFALPDPVAELAAVKLGEFGACEFAPGDALFGHPHRDLATQNVGLEHVIRPLAQVKSTPPISPANCLKMVNESLTRVAAYLMALPAAGLFVG